MTAQNSPSVPTALPLERSPLDMRGEWTPDGVGAVIGIACERLLRSHRPGKPGEHEGCETCRDYESRAMGLSYAAVLMGLPSASAEASNVSGQYGDSWRDW